MTALSGRIAECFYSIQGEGSTAGVPAVFIRLQGCSVGCAWCDTKYSWDPEMGREVTLDCLLQEVSAFPCRRAVVTGGEPLESPLFTPLIHGLKARGFIIEVETSGTKPPPPSPVDQWNVSLKLAGSKVAGENRIVPSIIREFVQLGAWWKFVVVDAADVAEVTELARSFSLPGDRILLMPEGIRSGDVLERSTWVIEQCERYGFRYSPRLHILFWGARRGV